MRFHVHHVTGSWPGFLTPPSLKKGRPSHCFPSSPSCRRTTISLSSLKLSSYWTHSFLLPKNTSLFSYPSEHWIFVPSLTFLFFLCLKWKTGGCFCNCNASPYLLPSTPPSRFHSNHWHLPDFTLRLQKLFCYWTHWPSLSSELFIILEIHKFF